MTLNDLERRNSPYFAFFSWNSTDFQVDYITVVVDRPIMSVNCCLSVPVFYFWRKLAARSLCDSWASCLLNLTRSIIACTCAADERCRSRRGYDIARTGHDARHTSNALSRSRLRVHATGSARRHSVNLDAVQRSCRRRWHQAHSDVDRLTHTVRPLWRDSCHWRRNREYRSTTGVWNLSARLALQQSKSSSVLNLINYLMIYLRINCSNFIPSPAVIYLMWFVKIHTLTFKVAEINFNDTQIV